MIYCIDKCVVIYLICINKVIDDSSLVAVENHAVNSFHETLVLIQEWDPGIFSGKDRPKYH